MPDLVPPPFFARLWLALVCLFRVIFDPEFAARVARLRQALPAPPSQPSLPGARPDAALHLLAVLQREGRLIDFCEEDVSAFSDADVGAAARTVHAGCRKVLRDGLGIRSRLGAADGQRRGRSSLHGQVAAPRLESRAGATAASSRGSGRHRAGAGGGGAAVTARYSVGIDLGTTNSAIAEVELGAESVRGGDALPGARPLEVPQIVALGEVAQRALLPSFLYLPSAVEAPKGAFALPWGETDAVVGQYARDRGALVPGRLVSSAKSWLSHPGVDRRGQLLPLGADPEVPRVSPIEASARILRHLRAAWDALHASEGLRLADQAVTLTVPASFDAVARELTVQAAAEAGLAQLTLLEEPQAALYAWVQDAGEAWRKSVRPGDVILVVDVGGGTSDFSLIAVGEEDGRRRDWPLPPRRSRSGEPEPTT